MTDCEHHFVTVWSEKLDAWVIQCQHCGGYLAPPTPEMN